MENMPRQFEAAEKAVLRELLDDLALDVDDL